MVMSVLIKGMKMPKEGCKDCPLVKRGQVFDICPFLNKREVNGNVERGGKPYECPIVELPDHGDLIDRSRLIGGFVDWYIQESPMYLGDSKVVAETIGDAMKAIEAAPVVIPAERSEE